MENTMKRLGIIALAVALPCAAWAQALGPQTLVAPLWYDGSHFQYNSPTTPAPFNCVSGCSGGGGTSSVVKQGAQDATAAPWQFLLYQGGSVVGSSNALYAQVTSSALPAGAATAANQTSSISNAGTSAAQAQTVQGSASGVPIPTSVATLPLPAGASTAANQTSVQSAAGTSATTLETVQGSATGVPVPVSGTVAAGLNAGTNNVGSVTIAVGGTNVATSTPVPSQLIPGTAIALGIGPVSCGNVAGCVGKSSAGNLYGYNFTNSTTAGFLAFLQVAAIPTANAAITPFDCVPVAASAYASNHFTFPTKFAGGLTVVFSTNCATYVATSPVPIEITTYTE